MPLTLIFARFFDLDQYLSHLPGTELFWGSNRFQIPGFEANAMPGGAGSQESVTPVEVVVTQAVNYETGDAVFAVDQNGVVVQWNPAAEKVFGYPARKAQGRKCWNLLRGRDVYGNRYCCRHCTLLRMAFQHESVNGFKVIYRTASKERKKFFISCLAVFNSDGDEQLLHICRPEREILQDDSNHLATAMPAENQIGTLTRREIEALKLLADGKSTREIARAMAVSTNTACNHIQHVLKKMKAHTRLEAVVLAKRLDLI